MCWGVRALRQSVLTGRALKSSAGDSALSALGISDPNSARWSRVSLNTKAAQENPQRNGNSVCLPDSADSAGFLKFIFADQTGQLDSHCFVHKVLPVAGTQGPDGKLSSMSTTFFLLEGGCQCFLTTQTAYLAWQYPKGMHLQQDHKCIYQVS